jgi:hypothetical protein
MSNGANSLKADLPHFQWGLLALLLALGVGVTVVMLAQSYFERAQKFQNSASKRLSDARTNLSAAQEDRLNMANYTQEYAAMLQRNIIGNENRLDWIDGLEAIRNQNLVLGFKYTIEPQKPYKPPVAVNSGNFSMNQSSMLLTFDLLHEGQLANFFRALRNNIKGQFLLDGCSIERVSSTSGLDTAALAPQLTATCRGEWLTLKNRNTP